MKKLFAYTRVSTTRQGENGVSLQQQKASIEQFCSRAGLIISEWLEEQETAAKSGRRVFSSMLKRLRAGDAAGVVMHKIDRSARNLKDWADLGQLIDEGIEVHFSNEAVDLHSRGGRLSADIQAVVAADYIRNLREEVKKGFYGRLKQGLNPMPAPLGYLNNGGGKPKTIDPFSGPIISQLFELYGTGRFTHRTLTDEVDRLGLRSRRGKPLGVNVVAGILANPFYIGVIRLKRSGQVFNGIHEPLTSLASFQRAQAIASSRAVRGPTEHKFRFGRFIKCKCGRSLIGETKRGYTYYRCHRRTCVGTNVREQDIDTAIWKELKGLHLTTEEVECIDGILENETQSERSHCEAEAKVLQLELAKLADRQNRLTDAYIDGALERSTFDERKAALMMERSDMELRLREVQAGRSEIVKNVERRVALIKSASLLYENGLSAESHDLMVEVVSHRIADKKNLVITVKEPLSEVEKRPKFETGGPLSDDGRNFWTRVLREPERLLDEGSETHT